MSRQVVCVDCGVDLTEVCRRAWDANDCPSVFDVPGYGIKCGACFGSTPPPVYQDQEESTHDDY